MLKTRTIRMRLQLNFQTNTCLIMWLVLPIVNKTFPVMVWETGWHTMFRVLIIRWKERELRLLLAATEDPEEIWRCKRRIAELTPMLTQMNELAELTAHYYDRGYYRNEKYTV